MKNPKISVVDGEKLIAVTCEISQFYSKEPDGPITHASVFWYDDVWDDKTGRTHIVPIEQILYERGSPEFPESVGIIHEPEIIYTRLAIHETLRNAVYDRDGRKCRSCGSEKDLAIDHIFPFSKGGKTELDNLQTLCGTCNRKKKARII